MLGLGSLIPPAVSGRLAFPKTTELGKLKTKSLQLIHVAVLGTASIVDRELKGSKPNSPCQPH